MSEMFNDLESTNSIPKDEIKKDEEYDLQKELEAKFDGLFGPIDDND